jgi:hypothetical protein
MCLRLRSLPKLQQAVALLADLRCSTFPATATDQHPLLLLMTPAR